MFVVTILVDLIWLYGSCHSITNLLQIAAQCTYKAWPSLSISPDCGPDMVCVAHFLLFCKMFNIIPNWDIAHLLKNNGKNVLKQSKMWKFVVLQTAANNCVYGSMLSPARLAQIRESVADYMEHTEPSQCEFFLDFLPHLVEQLDLNIQMTDPDVHQVVNTISK